MRRLAGALGSGSLGEDVGQTNSGSVKQGRGSPAISE